MIKAATIPLAFCLFFSITTAFGQAPLERTAVEESIRREADRLMLRKHLTDAAAAVARGDLAGGAKLYGAAWVLVQGIGPAAEAEAQQTIAGLTATRLELARAEQRRGNYRAAGEEIDHILRADPTNQLALAFKAENDKLILEHRRHFPSADAQAAVPTITEEKLSANTLVQDGRLYFEMGKLDEAERALRQAVARDPSNQAAYYYLNLVQEARYDEALSKREVESKRKLVQIEQAWADSVKRDALPVPNLYARTNLAHTGKGRQAIHSKLDRIRLDEVKYDGLNLGEVIIDLNDKAKKRDPDRRGINFILNPNIDTGAVEIPPGAVDPATGLPIAAAAPAEPVDMSAIQIRINPALTDVRLADVLDAIVKVADRRIKYSIEDYAVVFSLKGAEPSPLYVRIIKVDPNTFYQGLEAVVGFPFGNVTTGGQGGGGGGGGGGQGQNAITTVPRVQLTGATVQGGQGGGGATGGGGQGQGVRAVTQTNLTVSVQDMVRQFFTTMGVDLNLPKSVFFNDREGTLVVRATLQDLDMIETAVQVLNIAPPQVHIKSKFVEVSQTDNRALGFDWYLGNWLMNNSALGLQGGTAPSFSGVPSTANPEGTFPGSAVGGTSILPAPTDQLLTAGLRNQITPVIGAPAVATFSGILTDPQFRVVIRALEQRDGADLLNESSVTTLSGRQTQIQTVDLRTIVTGVDLQQNAAGGDAGLGGGGGAGVVGSQIEFTTETLPFGPTLDVIPYVSADGFTIQMTIIPTITEFLGYDDPGAFVPQAQSVSGGAGGAAIPIRAVLPLPHFRLRQVATSAIVWDGQTVVLGGLISEDVLKLKDKVPVIGDLPLVGRLFRSESSSTVKKNLMIFVTPTIIDPAGNRYHSEDEMPFNPNTIPPQRPFAPVP